MRPAAAGLPLGAPITWSTSAAAVAEVSSIGRVVANHAGTAVITATAGGVSATTTVIVAVNLRSASVGSELCGIDDVGTAYCGLFSDALAPAGHPAALHGVSAGHLFACGIDASGIGVCWGSNGDGELGRGTQDAPSVVQPPAPVSGGLAFDRIAAGSEHACGLTTDRLAYCWGDNSWGQLGDGITDRALTPVAVFGGEPLGVASDETFTAITVAANHACALAPMGQAFCWGLNDQGQLGNGTPGGRVDLPTAIGGTLRFRAISAAFTHTCALRGNGEAYCWGAGPIGIGTGATASVPTRVATNHRFATIAAGELRTCASTAGGATFCWGDRFTAAGAPPDPLVPARIPLIAGP